MALNRTFSAIRVHAFGEPSVLKWERNVQLPIRSLGPKHVLLRHHAAGVNPVDTYIRSGQYGGLPSLPYTPGRDGAGVVEEIGSAVSNVKPGDRVAFTNTLTGAYAQFGVSNCDDLIKLRPDMSFEEGACIGIPFQSAHRALFDVGKAKAGETVLVHGASGGVGIATVQLARGKGLTVWGTASSEKGRQTVLSLGAQKVFDHSDPNYVAAIATAAESHGGIDLIIEMAAHINLNANLELIRFGGRVVVVGSRGPVSIMPRLLMNKEPILTGMRLFNASQEELAAVNMDLADLLDKGINIIVDRTIPIAEASRAHEEVMGTAKAGKIVLTID